MCSIFLRVANFEKGVILNIFENVQSEFLVHPCNIRYKETSKVHNRTKEDDKSGKRKTRLAHGIYFAVGRMCDWNRQCMEISVYCRNVWGRHVCCLVSVFLIAMGVPVMTMEFAVGRASRKSIIRSFAELERPGQKWHLNGYLGMAGNYILMMFYTTVAGWMLYYFYQNVDRKIYRKRWGSGCGTISGNA